MANYVKFKQGLKKDFNTTNQPLTNGMIYFVIDEHNNGSIYYDTIVDGKQATKNGTVHRVKFSGLPIKITGSVTGTGVISQDGETIEINTSTNHSHGLAHQDFTVTLSNDDTNLKWTRLGNQNGEGFWLKSIKGNVKAPAWFQPNYGAGIAFGGGSTKGIISVKDNEPSIRFAGGNGDAPVWYFTITGANDKTYDLSKIGGHSSDSAKLDHNVTFKIASTADATNGANGTKTDLSGPAVNLYLPTKISGFDLLQASRFQGNADSATYATSAGYAKGLFLNPETRQEDINFNLADAKYIKKVTYSMATSITKKNKPPIGDANILSFGWDNSGYGSQLAIQSGGAGHLAVRGSDTANGASSWGEWSTVLDSSNYTSYINNYYWANVKVSTASSTETKPTFNTAYTSNWWRSTGKTGWWNDTYSGGIAMEDKTYVKVAGNKSFFIPNGSLKIGGNGDIFFATGYDDATLKIYGQTNTDFGAETIVIQTCFDNRDPQTSEYTTQYANRCNLLLQPRGGQVYIGKNLTTPGDTGYKLFVDGNQWTSGNQWVNGSLFFTDITGNTADTGMSLKGIYGRIGGNDGWRIAGGARANNAGYLEIATCDDMNKPIYVRQYGGGGDWNGYVSLARTFTLLDAAGRSRAPELFEAKKVHVNSLLNQSTAIADIGYQFQVTGTSNFTDSVDISGVTTHHNNIQIDANYSITKPGKNSAWYGSHNNAMIRMTSVNNWSPLLAQKATNGYWILGHYNYHNEKDENDKNSDFRDQWVFGYLADSNLEGTTGASNSLTTTYRLLNIGDQRMFVSAKYNAAVGSGTQPVYVQSNGNVATCSYSLSATIEAGTANRMAYYKAVNQIGSSGHYVTSSQVGINSNTTHDFTFYVGGNSYFSNLVTVYAGNNLGVKIGNTNITAIDGSLIFQNNTALRFGSSEWDWNKWAGLKYVPDSKTIVMGLADSINFTANAVQSGGTFLFTGMSSIDLNKTASIKNLAVGGGIYWNPYVENAGDGSDAASITVIAHGAANGTELRIQQQNEANDIINLVVNNSIFLNGKRAFRPFDGWLRINEDSSFNYGIYTGSSLIRSDNQLQVGDSGNKFYANSAGNGYFSNTLGIAGTNTNYRLYVDGKTWLRDALYIGSDTNGKNKNYIAFYGTYGDGEGYFNHTYIGENVFSTSGESSELVLFKGNDQGSNDTVESITSSGPDRIRHIAAGHLFQVYRTALSGSFSDVCASTAPSTVLEVNGGGLSIHGQKITFTTTNSSGSSINSIGSVVRIYGNTYGNDANYLISKTAGVFSYGDGGPQIRFGTNYAGNQQEGALIYTDHDSAGVGVSWHFVSNQSDWSVNSKRYVARTSVTIGNLLPNTSYALYVGGGESYYTNHINMQKNASILFPQVNQFLRWTSSTSNNNSTGLTWYGIGTYQAGDSYNWLNISNYWGINITTKNDTHLQHNGKVLTNSGNATGTVGSSTKPVYSNQGVLTPITSYEGNAATATTASKLSRNAGSATKPIYFSEGIPVQCNDTLGVSISGNAATATVASSANKLNTSAGGNTNPIYFTNGVPVKSTASVGSANQPVYLNNGVITACAGSQSGTEKQQSFKVDGANGTVHWYYLGNLVSKGDGSEVIIDIYTGNGYNGTGDQNTHISIFVKDGWQSTQAAANSFGISYLVDHSDVNATAIKVKGMASAHNVIDLYVYLPWSYSNGYYSIKGYYSAWTHKGIRSTTEPTSGEVQNCVFGTFRAGQVYGAVWNDYAEYRQTKKYVQPGYCVIETGKGDLIKSSERLQPGANIVSDTFGFAIGETEQTKTPLAVSGRVLAYPYEDRDSYQAGDPVCSGPNGTISKMTREEVREYPDRIIGTISEIPDYEVWGTGNVKVNNRIWIKVK